MDVVVRSRNRTIPPRLQALAHDKALRIARFTHDAGRVEIDFAEVRTPRIEERQLCEVTVHLKRRFLRAHAAASRAEVALDGALAKVEHQVARLKDRRVSRSHGRRGNGVSGDDGRGSGDAAAATDPETEPDDDVPRIVKTKHFVAKPMDPDEAALQMQLLGYAFFLFTNTETGHAAVLYRRNDGNLGLIETG